MRARTIAAALVAAGLLAETASFATGAASTAGSGTIPDWSFTPTVTPGAANS